MSHLWVRPQSGRRVSFCSLTCQFSEACESQNQVGVITSEMRNSFCLPDSTKRNPFKEIWHNFKTDVRQPTQETHRTFLFILFLFIFLEFLIMPALTLLYNRVFYKLICFTAITKKHINGVWVVSPPLLYLYYELFYTRFVMTKLPDNGRTKDKCEKHHT